MKRTIASGKTDDLKPEKEGSEEGKKCEKEECENMKYRIKNYCIKLLYFLKKNFFREKWGFFIGYEYFSPRHHLNESQDQYLMNYCPTRRFEQSSRKNFLISNFKSLSNKISGKVINWLKIPQIQGRRKTFRVFFWRGALNQYRRGPKTTSISCTLSSYLLTRRKIEVIGLGIIKFDLIWTSSRVMLISVISLFGQFLYSSVTWSIYHVRNHCGFS